MDQNQNNTSRIKHWVEDSIIAFSLCLLILGTFLASCIWMPGKSFEGPPPPLTSQELALHDLLRQHVHTLSQEIGERNLQHYDKLENAADYIETQFQQMGLETRNLPYEYHGNKFRNIEAKLVAEGLSRSSIVLGAHYDTAEGTPGANDNATGVAVLLELARLVKDSKLCMPIRFVAFANEEPPYFGSREGMGSIEYLRSFQNPAEEILCMLSLECIGLFIEGPNSQKYPPLVGFFYPDRGNFIAFVGDFSSRQLVRQVLKGFRQKAAIPSEGLAAPAWVPGVSLSDHRSFWEADIPALMVTDTAFFRDETYHQTTDTSERLQYEQMARVVKGLSSVVIDLACKKL